MRKIDTTAFSVDILQSRLYGELELDADGYADLFDAEVKRVLDMRRHGQVVVAVASTTAGTYRTRRAMPSSSVGDLNVGTVEPGLLNCTWEHPQVTSRSHQVRTRRRGPRCSCHMANGTESVAQQTQGRVR